MESVIARSILVGRIPRRLNTKPGVRGPRPRSQASRSQVERPCRKLSQIKHLDLIVRLDAERPDSYTPRRFVTEFRGDRCVRHYRQATIPPMLKNS